MTARGTPSGTAHVSRPERSTDDDRLRALARARVLDTPPEAEFDDLARLAASVCGTPVALVGLLDRDRLWLKSRIGLGAAELPRDGHLSDHAIRRPDLFEVPDALADEHARAHPLVAAAPHVRFVAGMPLTTPGGLAVGTLCVMDFTPRTLTDAQRDALRVLARQVVAALERRVREGEWERTTAALRESEERFRAIFQGTSAGISLTDAGGRFVSCNPAFAGLVGRRVGEVIGRTPADFTHPDDWAVQKYQFEAARAGGPDRYNVTKRYLRPDGSSVWAELSFAAIHAADGRYRFGLGVTVDVTERKRAEAALRESEERFRAAMEGSLDAVYFLTAERDAGGAVTDFAFADLNRRGEQLIARGREAVLGRRLCELLPVNRTGGHFDKYVRVVETGHPLEEEFPISVDGVAAAWIHHQVVKVGDGVAITSRDITDRKWAEVALRASEEQFRNTVERLAEGVAVIDLDTRAVVRANGAFLDLLGYTADEMAALTLGDFVAHEPNDIDRQLAEVVRAGQVRCCGCRYRRKGGAVVDVSVSASLVPGDGRPRLSLVVRDVSEQLRYERQLLAYQTDLEQANAKLRRLATTDGLTGVNNRAAFDKALTAEFQRAVRNGEPFSLLLIDVDHFKAFNDAFGHPAGDAVLTRVAAALTAAARGTDVVARYGGEEFAVLLPDTDSAGALVAAERLRRAVASVGWDLRAVTISVGVATRGDDTGDEKVLVTEADQALYRSKREGRNRVNHGSQAVPVGATRR